MYAVSPRLREAGKGVLGTPPGESGYGRSIRQRSRCTTLRRRRVMLFFTSIEEALDHVSLRLLVVVHVAEPLVESERILSEEEEFTLEMALREGERLCDLHDALEALL